LETATKKKIVFDFIVTDHLRTKIIINYETLEQVSQFTYLGCSILGGETGGKETTEETWA